MLIRKIMVLNIKINCFIWAEKNSAKIHFNFWDMLILILSFFLLIIPGQLLQNRFYVDPDSTNPIQTGDIYSPFVHLSDAFQALENSLESEFQNFEIHLKENSTFSNINLSFPIEKTGNLTQVLTITTYSLHTTNQTEIIPATLLFERLSDHLSIKWMGTLVNIKHISFKFNIIGDYNQYQEIIFIESSYRISLFNCLFENFQSTIVNKAIPIFLFKADRTFFQNNLFRNFTISNTFVSILANLICSFEILGSKLVNISSETFLRREGKAYLKIIQNEILNTFGTLLNGEDYFETIFNDNIIENIHGNYPIRLSNTNRLAFENNIISFSNWNKSLIEGILKVSASEILRIMNNTLKGYHSNTSAILISQGNYRVEGELRFIFIRNSDFVKDSILNSSRLDKTALININLEKQYKIYILDCRFIENSEKSGRSLDSKGVSTLFISAKNSIVDLENVTFERNQASKSTQNLKIFPKTILINNSIIDENYYSKNEKTRQFTPVPFQNLNLSAKRIRILNTTLLF